MKTSIYKNEAIESLNGKWGSSATAVFVYFCVYFIPSVLIDIIIPMSDDYKGVTIGDLWLIPMDVVAWGITVYFLPIAQKQNSEINDLFVGFKDFWRIFGTRFVKGLFTFLWTLLFIIPGIVKYYSYSMTDFILKDTDLSFEEAIDESIKMMKGHKMELFCLDLSFIGWHILSCLTLGIGYLFLLPYITTAHAHFYYNLKGERECTESIGSESNKDYEEVTIK